MHSHGDSGDVQTARWPRNLLLAVLAGLALATAAGLIILWPAPAQLHQATSKVQFAAPGVTFPKARITKISSGCPDEQSGPGAYDPADPSAAPANYQCWTATVTVLTGDGAGRTTQVELPGPLADSGLVVGDELELTSIPPDLSGKNEPAPTGSDQASAGPIDSVFGIVRTNSLAVLTIGFVVAVVAVARLRGLLALAALAFTGFMVINFVLPALLVGHSGTAVALVGAAAIMFVVLYLAHGVSIRTSAALAGTLCGIAITALIAQYSVGYTRLSGVGDESAGMLAGMAGQLDFRGLLTCAIIIAGLGVLNDVTITQSSAVWELRSAGPNLHRRQLFTSAMRIGRDHIASTIYTIVFAYAGAALSVLLLLYLYDRPMLDLLTQEDLATEVVRTLVTAIGLVLAVPITTAIAAALVTPAATSSSAERAGDLVPDTAIEGDH